MHCTSHSERLSNEFVSQQIIVIVQRELKTIVHNEYDFRKFIPLLNDPDHIIVYYIIITELGG